jgi:hypothetical protein
MRKQMVALALLLQVVVAPDALFKDRVRVTENGERVGEIRRDYNNERHYRVYDRNGNLKGIWKKDFLFEDRYRYEGEESE